MEQPKGPTMQPVQRSRPNPVPSPPLSSPPPVPVVVTPPGSTARPTGPESSESAPPPLSGSGKAYLANSTGATKVKMDDGSTVLAYLCPTSPTKGEAISLISGLAEMHWSVLGLAVKLGPRVMVAVSCGQYVVAFPIGPGISLALQEILPAAKQYDVATTVADLEALSVSKLASLCLCLDAICHPFNSANGTLSVESASSISGLPSTTPANAAAAMTTACLYAGAGVVSYLMREFFAVKLAAQTTDPEIRALISSVHMARFSAMRHKAAPPYLRKIFSAITSRATDLSLQLSDEHMEKVTVAPAPYVPEYVSPKDEIN